MTGREAARLSEAHRRYQAALAAASDLEGRRRVVEEVVPTWWGPLPGDIDVEQIDMRGVAAESVRAPGAISGRVVLYVHGGGLTLGSPAIVRTLVANIARLALARGVVPQYRLAPEHVWPAQAEDIIAAYRWLLHNGSDPTSVVLAGESAGAGAMYAALLALKEQQLPQPAGAIAISPMVDLEFKGASWTINADRDLLSREGAVNNVGVFLPDGDPAAVSPLNQDLAGLCPLLIQVGDAECIRDDAIAFAEKAREANVDVSLQIWEGMVHMWQSFGYLPEARHGVEQMAAFTVQQTAQLSAD